MTQTQEIQQTLTLLCSKYNLAYNIQHLPVKIGPDCYLFYATKLTDKCRKEGKCKESKYYALTGGDKVLILDKNMKRLNEVQPCK